MKHVVIGGAGFLGVEIVRQLTEMLGGQRIVVIDAGEATGTTKFFLKHEIISYRRDISRAGAFLDIELEENDVVHHLASRLIVANKPRFGRYDYFKRTTVDGTAAVLSWIKSTRCRHLVFWSTDMVYGYPKELPVNERMIPRPLGPYGETKLLAEKLVLEASKRFGLAATIFRPRLIIGPGRLGILERLFRLAEKNWPVPMIGDGNNTFQFVGLSDCARASIIAAERGCPTDVFNLGSDNPPLVRELLGDFLKEIGSQSTIVPTPATASKFFLEFLNVLKISPMDQEQFRIADRSMFVSNEKAKSKLDWMPKKDDLSMLVEAYESYQNGKKPTFNDNDL